MIYSQSNRKERIMSDYNVVKEKLRELFYEYCIPVPEIERADHVNPDDVVNVGYIRMNVDDEFDEESQAKRVFAEYIIELAHVNQNQKDNVIDVIVSIL